MNRQPPSLTTPHRHGFLTIVVLVALIVTLTICMNMARTLISLRGVSVLQDQRLQVEILTSTFLDYARSKQQASADYTGESINLSAADWQQSYPAKVTITIDTESKQIQVQAQSFSEQGELILSMTKTSPPVQAAP